MNKTKRAQLNVNGYSLILSLSPFSIKSTVHFKSKFIINKLTTFIGEREKAWSILAQLHKSIINMGQIDDKKNLCGL